MELDTKALKGVLENGESVNWFGKAEPFPAIDRFNKKSFLMRSIISIVIGLVLIVFYCIKMKGNILIGFPVIIAGIVIFVILTPILDARTLKKKRTFIITDRNLYSLESGTQYKKMALKDIDEVLFIDKENSTGDVLFGSAAIKRPYRRIRATTLTPIESSSEGGSRICGMVFYNIADYEKIRPFLPEGIKISKTVVG